MNAAKGCSITGRLDTKNTKFTGHKEGRSHAKRRNANQYHTGRAENAPDMGHTHTAPQQNDALGGGGGTERVDSYHIMAHESKLHHTMTSRQTKTDEEKQTPGRYPSKNAPQTPNQNNAWVLRHGRAPCASQTTHSKLDCYFTFASRA